MGHVMAIDRLSILCLGNKGVLGLLINVEGVLAFAGQPLFAKAFGLSLSFFRVNGLLP